MAPIKATLSALALSLFTFASATTIPHVDYDVIVVGGGPAGLSAMSGLSRVKRTALMLDSQEYRNAPTRNMHDVIGNDGTVPAVFRAAAREQISVYPTATMKNATVVSISQVNGTNATYFVATDDAGTNYTTRRIVLGTGMRDVLPATPGIEDAWGKGMFWCPWCDGYEHRDQPLAVLGNLSDVLSSVIELRLLNQEVVALVNGTDTPAQRDIATNRSATWQEQLQAYNVRINNATIARIERIQNGSETNDPEQHKQFDKFRVHFADSSSAPVEVGAFMANFPTAQRSTLPTAMGLNVKDEKIVVSPKMLTSLTGVYAVGDANSDGSTNVPHAMYSGKRAAVVIHVELAKEESLASIGKRGSFKSQRDLEREASKLMGDEIEQLWKKAQIA